MNNLLLSKLLILENIENIKGKCYVRNIDVLKYIMYKCNDKIKKYDIEIIELKNHKDALLSPLRLLNANYLSIRDFGYHILWSNKCSILKLDDFKYIYNLV